ncbi:MAG: hypothetical protein ABW170_19410 [Candidatus Thiodiazotropha sp. L084R]
MNPINILIWTCTLVFVATATITLLGLVGALQLGGGDGTRHDHYLSKLFTVLIIEIVVVSVGAFGIYASEYSTLLEAAQLAVGEEQ